MKKHTTTKAKRPTTKKSTPHAEPPALARLEKQLRTLLARGEANAYAIGTMFDRIARAGLHREAGFASLEAYADARFTQGYATLKRYRRVATTFTRASVLKHTVTKLDLGLSYIALTPEHERPADLFTLDIRVPDRGGKFTLVPFAKATTTQLSRAIERAHAQPTAHDDLAEARAKRARLALQAAVAAPKGTHQHAPAVRAHLTDDHALRFDVLGIDASDLERIGRALIAHARAHRAPAASKIA